MKSSLFLFFLSTEDVIISIFRKAASVLAKHPTKIKSGADARKLVSFFSNIQWRKEIAHGKKKSVTGKRNWSRRKGTAYGEMKCSRRERFHFSVTDFLSLWPISFRHEQLLFAVSNSFSLWPTSFCREQFLFAVSYFFLPCAISFCRDQLLFAVSNFFLAVINFFSLWAISFCREQFLFTVTVMGHRKKYGFWIRHLATRIFY